MSCALEPHPHHRAILLCLIFSTSVSPDPVASGGKHSRDLLHSVASHRKPGGS